MSIIFIFIIGMMSLLSCQQAPTRLNQESQVLPSEVSSTKPMTKEQTQDWVRRTLKSQPVFLDTRSVLDFGVSHIPGAINIRWQDFSITKEGQTGLLQSDSFAIARRLSLWGIQPNTPVVVVGDIRQSHGEEGRIAWMLKYLGIEEVSIADHKLFRSSIAREEMSRENKPSWIPQVQEQLLLTQAEFLNKLNRDIVVLDVRLSEQISLQKKSELEIFKNTKAKIVKMNWRDFYTDDGFVNRSIQDQLKKNGLDIKNEIVIISQNGVQSAAVTFALQSMGWTRTSNYAGGYEELASGLNFK